MTSFGKLSTFIFGAVSLHAFNKFNNGNHCPNHISCDEKSSLRLAMVYFRHGRRTPILKKIEVTEVEWPLEWVEHDLPHTMFDYEVKNANLFPKTLETSLMDQSYSNLAALKGGAGQGLLTKFGQEDSFNLGKRLRKRYIDGEKLVPPYYSDHHVKLYTTFIKRTVKSMRCVLAGMFDKEGSEIAAVYSRPNDMEYYFPNFEYCLRYKNIYLEALRRENEASHLGHNREKLAKILEKDVEELPDITHLWEEIYFLDSHGFELPENIKLAYDVIKKMASEIVEYRYFEFRPLQMKLAIGFLLDDLNEVINNHITGDDCTPLYLHSTHDTTLIAIMMGLGCYDGVWPDVSSYFAVELHNIDNEWLIRFVYNDEPIVLKESSNGFVPLHKFKSLIKTNLLGNRDFDDVCSIDDIQKILK